MNKLKENDFNGMFTGMYDRDGRAVMHGDSLDFDEDEWGCRPAPVDKILINEMIGEWPYHGCKSDVSIWRRIVDEKV